MKRKNKKMKTKTVYRLKSRGVVVGDYDTLTDALDKAVGKTAKITVVTTKK